MPRHINLQDDFINRIRKKKVMVTLYLVNGVQLRGTVSAFDNFTLLLDVNGRQQLVYKHAVSTVTPSVNLSLEEASDE